ncbi:4957_t:CDS:2 [Paraglomus occultum]|uniref:4957_t:CDS:1 n=2 Tax=Glomeromycetes TaxID=214506 RepID=A0A9N9BUD7_9GLOM|nr:4957_t:CDS:2 [Paraglomus occultum]
MSSELDFLRQENAKLVAENAELKHENSKLKQIIEDNAEFKAKIMKLEQTVDKIEKQNHDISQSPVCSPLPVTSQLSSPPPIEDHSDKEYSVSVNQLKTEPVSLEDRVVDEFVDSMYKEQVSNEIRDRSREKKLQRESAGNQAQDLSQFHEITSRDMESRPQVNHNTKTVPSGNDQSHVILTESPSLQTEVSELEQDDEIDKNQIVEQGLIQELHLPTKENDSSIKISNSGDKSGNMSSEESMIVSFGNSAQHLSHLFKTAIRSRQQEILNWYYYSLEFENKVRDITADGKTKDKTARTMIYKEMKHFLPNITQDNLRKKTLRARKLLMLFGKDGVGIDKIKQVTYSANEISKLTNVQIQNIINQVTLKTVPSGNDQTNAEKVIIAVQSLPETQGRVPNKISNSSIHPNKTRLYQPEAGLRQYAIEHGMDPEKFSVITEAEKNQWVMGCFPANLERDIRLYRGGIKRNEDTRKYHKFLTDRDRLIGEELLRRSILKSGLSTTWLDDLMKEWEEIHTQFIQIFSQT